MTFPRNTFTSTKGKTVKKELVALNLMIWEMLDPRMTPDALGFIPEFLVPDDPRPAREQINERYVSGWQSFDGFKMDPETHVLSYPGDPEFPPLAQTMLRDELILFYDCAWVAIVQKDGTFDIARLD